MAMVHPSRPRRSVRFCLAAALATGLSLPALVTGPAQAQIPAPSATTAVVHVRAGDQRTGATAIGPLQGARFGLFTSNPSASISDSSGFVVGLTPAYQCTSDAQGDCSFVVTIGSGGVAQNTRLWVAPIGGPAGYFANPYFQTAPLTGGGQVNLRHVFQTPQLVANQTYTAGTQWITDPGQQTNPTNSTSEFTRRTASSGVWPLSRANPGFPEQCGVDVALVVDLSASVNSAFSANPANRGPLQQAMDGIVDALRGTPSRVEIITFGSDSPARGYQNFALTSVATTAEANGLKTRYQTWPNPNGQGNYTNWDRGLAATAATEASGNHVDLAVLLTDGNPTVYGPNATGAAPSGYTRFRELENGIASANQLKGLGTRVLAMGVGDGVGSAGAAYNLRSVSGQVAYNGSNALAADYYQTTQYTEASEALRRLVVASCAPSISVIKRVVPNDWTDATPIDDVAQTPGETWNFTAAAVSGGSVNAPATQDTHLDTGALSFDVDVDSADTPGQFRITENGANQDGYEFLDDQTTCIDRHTGSDVAVPTTPGDPGSFALPVGIQGMVSCTVYNRLPPDVVPAAVTLHKRWRVITDQGTTVYLNGQQPLELQGWSNMSLPASPAVLNPNPESWDVAREGFAAGQTVNITETFLPIDLPGCQATRSAILPGTPDDVPADGGPDWPAPGNPSPYQSAPLVAGENHFTITNDITCHSYLTLRKQVGSGDADPASWSLQALGPDGALDGPAGRTGEGAATHVEVTPDAIYQLAEQADDQPEGLRRYAQLDLRSRPLLFPRSTGSWTCHAEGDASGADSLGTQGAVAVPLGQEWVCTAINQTAFLDIIKIVDGGDAAPGDFSFHVAPVDPDDPDAAGQTVSGAAAPGTQVNVRPDTPYHVTEVSGPPGYVLTDLLCSSGRVVEDPTGFTIHAGGSVQCSATNTHTTWTTGKTSDPASGTQVQPGSVITYTLTASQLTGPYTNDAVVTDDLSDVLDDGTLVESSIDAQEGTAELAGTTLTWTIPRLTGTVTLTYQVRVNDDAWGASLRNVVVAPEPPTGPAGPADPEDPGDSEYVPCVGADCDGTTNNVVDEPVTPTPPPGPPGPPGGDAGGIAETGAPVDQTVTLAIALLAAGLVCLGAGRRVRRLRRR